MSRRDVVLGFSGGVDSTTAATLLKAQGYDVTALTLDTISDEKMMDRARQRADDIGVKLLTENVGKNFKRLIINYFANSYIAGRTPAPCTLCNPLIKWSSLASVADRLGVEAIATGHYFNIEQVNGRYYVARAEDLTKDQSYYLWGLTQGVLARALTPMGRIKKQEIIKNFSDKRESMGLCFLAGRSYREYIEQHYPEAVKSGDIVDCEGRIVGRHDGVAFYTIGQKRGLDVADKGLCIVGIDARQNRIIVGENSQLYYSTLEISECNIVDKEEFTTSNDVMTIIRGIGRNPEGFVRRIEPTSDGYRITLDDPAWAPAAGQPMVFYRGNRVIGGGIIERYY